MKQPKENMTILVDSREQKPLSFTFPSMRATLPTGDYSIQGYENRVAVERKEVNDLVSCLKGENRARFERELVRGQSLEFFCLVAECSLEDLAQHRYRSKMEPKSVIQSLFAFSVRYRLPIFFCHNRQYAARTIESLLQKFAMEVQNDPDIQAVEQR